MKWNPLRQFLTMAAAGLMCVGGLPCHADADDRVQPATLGLAGLIQEGLARNPEIQAARKQWEAAGHRIRQAQSLDDPTLSVQLWNLPQNFNVTQAQNSIFGLSQSFPFPGKLDLKGEVASRSAEMAEQALHAKERNVIGRVKQAYYELFLAHKAIEIHHQQLRLVKDMTDIATSKFRAGRGSQAEVLKAQVELSILHQHLPLLEQRRTSAEALINTLLNRDTRSPLGMPQDPPPTGFNTDVEALHRLAVGTRPELKASELAVHRNEQARALAQRQYYPDFTVAFQRFQNFQANDGFGAYLSVNVPFAFWSKPKYDAGVREAAAAVGAAQAEYHTLENLTLYQIQDLLAKVRTTEHVASLYRTTVLPQAEQSVEAARVGYRTGKAGLLDLIEAERSWRDFQLEYYRSLVEREHRLAELEQVVGKDLGRQS